MEQKTIIEIKEAVPRFENLQFQNSINWQIKEGEHWAIIGANGAGKTLLINILTGKFALKSGEVVCKDDIGDNLPVSSVVKSVAFQDIYSIIDTQNSYYQQRWNKGDEQEVPIVKDLVQKADQIWLNTLVEWFDISDLMEKEINLLSSGELRKFLIVRSLLSRPRILIMDNPYIGLDTSSRIILNELFSRLGKIENLQIVLILSNPDDIPDMITNILPIKQKQIYPISNRTDFLANTDLIDNLFSIKGKNNIESLNNKENELSYTYKNAVLLRDIHIRYCKRTILKDLNWNIKRGEKWALLGPNGSGKSTLLSLICGDNPQAYANDITLFDIKRGTGESIWDIKKHIGYISPEMHLYYLKNVKTLDVVSSGFFDTIGLYRKCSEEQEAIALEWMKLFGIEHIQGVSFLNISAGEQRLALLARVFVKNPELLILDEPLHGLDVTNKKRIKKIIEEYCDDSKSLIYVTHYESEIPSIIDHRMVLTKNI